MKRLKYIFPNKTAAVIDCGEFREDDSSWRTWLDVMVSEKPEVIFFATVETTDVF
jgi:hypothetical protein